MEKIPIPRGVIKVKVSLLDQMLNGNIFTKLKNIFEVLFSPQKHIQRETS